MIQRIKNTTDKLALYISMTALFLLLKIDVSYAGSGGPNCNSSAANLAGVATDVVCETSRTPRLIASGCYVMGIGFTIAGLIKMRDYVDNPSQAFMKDALIRLAVGACLLLLPWVIFTFFTSGGGTATVPEIIDQQSLNAFSANGS